MNTYKGFLALLSCAAIFSGFSVFIRFLEQDFTSYQQIVYRNGIAFLMAVILLLVTRKKIAFNNVPPKVLFLYAIAFPITVILFTLSVLQTTILNATIGLYVGTIVISQFIGSAFFKEKFTFQNALSLVLVISGLTLFIYPLSLATFNIGFWLGVASGATDAIANTLRRFLGGKVDRFVLVPIPMIGGIIIAGILTLSSGQPLVPESISMQSWLILSLFGFALLLINYLMLVGFQNLNLNLGSIVLSSELFFALLFGIAVFAEYPTQKELIGGIIIMTGVIAGNVDLSRIMKKEHLAAKP